MKTHIVLDHTSLDCQITLIFWQLSSMFLGTMFLESSFIRLDHPYKKGSEGG